MANTISEESNISFDFNLTEDDLSNEAKHLFPFYKEIRENLNYYGHRILDNNLISSDEKYFICSKIIQSYNNVKNVFNYLSTKPLETKQEINKFPIIIICGLPRSGTTLLYNLMACDPLCRAPRLTDMSVEPIPPILRSNIDEHKRRIKIGADFDAKLFENAKCDIKRFRENFSSSHPIFLYEEDLLLLGESGFKFIYLIFALKDTDVSKWHIDPQNKDAAYHYHQTVLQMLHDCDPPQTHWQLKSPLHTLWIDTLLKYYPNASLIMSHRRLDQFIPSSYRFSCAVAEGFFTKHDSNNLKTIMSEMTSIYIDTCINRLMEFRNRQSCSNDIFDIQYEDLMKDPIGTVHRIYDHFDFLKWSDEFEEAMRTWLINNPQGKQGRNSYSLDEFNLETQMNKQIYKDYEKKFLLT